MQKGFFEVVVVIAVLVLAAVGGAYYLGTQKGKIVLTSTVSPDITISPSSTVSPDITISPSPIPEETSNWRTYTIKSVGLEFELPHKIAENCSIKEETIPGITGSELKVSFASNTELSCQVNNLRIGTTSGDYYSERGGGYTDGQGFKMENGEYYYIFSRVVDKDWVIPFELVKQANTVNNVKIIKIKGKGSADPLDENYIGGGVPSEGFVAALINTNNKIYPGLTLLLEPTSQFTEKDFDQTLSTFKFAK